MNRIKIGHWWEITARCKISHWWILYSRCSSRVWLNFDPVNPFYYNQGSSGLDNNVRGPKGDIGGPGIQVWDIIYFQYKLTLNSLTDTQVYMSRSIDSCNLINRHHWTKTWLINSEVDTWSCILLHTCWLFLLSIISIPMFWLIFSFYGLF